MGAASKGTKGNQRLSGTPKSAHPLFVQPCAEICAHPHLKAPSSNGRRDLDLLSQQLPGPNAAHPIDQRLQWFLNQSARHISLKHQSAIPKARFSGELYSSDISESSSSTPPSGRLSRPAGMFVDFEAVAHPTKRRRPARQKQASPAEM
jgi:hypothetical protein